MGRSPYEVIPMRKAIAALRKLLFAVKIMVQAVVAPIAQVVKKTLKGEPITVGILAFATWRLVVWLAFLLCATGSIGVPAVIAYLFLVDLTIVGVQTVFFAVA